MWSAIASGIRLLLKSKALSKILKWILPILLGSIILFVVLIFYISSSLITSLTEHGEDEIERLKQNQVGGVIQNPRTDYKDNEIPKEFKEIYKEVAEKHDVDWRLLASIHRVETNFSSNLSTSSAGAIGHTQFMKCTWIGWNYKGCQGGLGNADIPDDILTDAKKIRIYGGQGIDGNNNGKADPNELSDALSATAKKLKDDGVNENLEKAIFSYNQSSKYVSDVKKYYEIYLRDAKFVTAGIDDIKKLGKGRTGFQSEIVGDMALPIAKDIFLKNMSFGIGDYAGHPGYDFVAPIGTPVFSMTDGTVVEIQTGRPNKKIGSGLALALSDDDLGNYIKVKPNDDPSVIISYFHLTSDNGVHVKKGDKVKKGQQIGLSGNSGKTTGPHLHVDMLKGGVYKIDHAIHWYDELKKELEKKD